MDVDDWTVRNLHSWKCSLFAKLLVSMVVQ